MDMATTVGVVVGGTAIINFSWRFFERATRQKDIQGLMKFKTQMEIKIDEIEQRRKEDKDSNSGKFNTIMSDMKEVRTEITSVSKKMGEVKGAFDVILKWMVDDKKK